MMHTPCRSIFLLLIVCVVLLSEAVLAASQPVRRQLTKRQVSQKIAPVPLRPVVPASIFTRGETLKFSATFNQLDAGGGEIQLRQEKQTDGRDVFRFIGKAHTSDLVDVLYKRRDNADATFGISDYAPLSFFLQSREGNRRREYNVRYDPVAKALIGSVTKKSRMREQSYPLGNVYDPVSALYQIRSRDLSPGTSIETQIVTGKGLYRFIAQVVKTETIAVDGKKRPALRLHPEVYSLEKDTHENILPKETTLWVSADPLHVPLKLESGTVWGWIVVELDGWSLKSE